MSDSPSLELPGPRVLLERFGLRPKHSFGQNFLGDVHLASQIARHAAPNGDERVLELGAGLGALSCQLLSRGCSLVMVERDRHLVPALAELFAAQLESGQAALVEGDAKAVDWLALLGPGGPRVVCGNLPYQITGPLLSRTAALRAQIVRAVYLIQKEVADRLVAAPGTKDYGALSVFLQAQFEIRKVLSLKPGAFYPSPRVDSAVCVLTSRSQPLTEESPRFRQLVKAAFAARRKTLRNAWRGITTLEVLEPLAADAGISLDARGETLAVEQFAGLARRLTEVQGPRADQEPGEVLEPPQGEE